MNPNRRIPVIATVVRDILGDCQFLIPLGSEHAGSCESGELTVTGFAGEVVYIFIATEAQDTGPIFDGFPCGSVNAYTLEVSAP